jgi:twinkle protein
VLREKDRIALERRGISGETADRLGFESCGDGFDIRIPSYDHGKIVNWKYRTLDKQKKMKQELGAKKVLWNIDALRDPTLAGEPVIITEGELDGASAIEAGYTRVVSVPDGAPGSPVADTSTAKYTYLDDEVLNLLRAAPEIIIAADGDTAGAALLQDLNQIIDEPGLTRWVSYPKPKDKRPLKDLNDALVIGGPKLLSLCIERAKPMPVGGIYTEDELPPPVRYRAHRTNFPGLDQHFLLRKGDLSVVTGVPGHGKSTFVDDIMCRAADIIGWRILVMSLENDPRTDLKDTITAWKGGARPGKLSAEELADIGVWRKDRFRYLLPSIEDTVDLDWLRSRVKVAVQRHKCDMIVIDPWNELDHVRDRGMSGTEYVGEAIKLMKRLALKYGVHVMVVAHPAKPDRFQKSKTWKPTLYDISDSAHWYNKSDAGIVVYRNPDTDETEILIEKIKYQNIIGKRGVVRAAYDWSAACYRTIEAGGEEGPVDPLDGV